MPTLSPTDWRIQVKIFEKFGCRYVRQKGSHFIYHHPDAKRAVVIMRTVNMSREQYFQLFTEV